MHYLKRMTIYNMVMIGGKARMSRPSSVLYPLPTRAERLNRYAHVRTDNERTMVKADAWKPGALIARPTARLVFP